MAGYTHGQSVRHLAKAITPVIDALESRRLLSAAGVEEDLVVSDDGAEDAILYPLQVQEGDESLDKGEGDGSESPIKTPSGEGSEEDPEIIYYTMDGEADGEVTTTSDDEELDPRAVETGGEVDLGEGQDLDGDGEPDVIYYTLNESAGSLDAHARLKKNGTLTVRGTSGDDDIQIMQANGQIEVKVGGESLGKFDLDQVHKIKIAGGEGNDKIEIAADINIDARVKGQAGNDTVNGGAGDDRITGGGGNDSLDGRGGSDRVRGGKGDDDVKGGNGVDDLLGGRGKDKLRGGRGNDGLRGGHGLDKIRAGAGNDLIDGGEGADDLMGDEGIDGCQDKEDALGDSDANDAKFSATRLAKPFWWNQDGSFDQICLADPEGDGPVCDDTPTGQLMPIWWNPNDPDSSDTGDAARIDPSQFPDGNYPDDTSGGEVISNV